MLAKSGSVRKGPQCAVEWLVSHVFGEVALLEVLAAYQPEACPQQHRAADRPSFEECCTQLEILSQSCLPQLVVCLFKWREEAFDRAVAELGDPDAIKDDPVTGPSIARERLKVNCLK